MNDAHAFLGWLVFGPVVCVLLFAAIAWSTDGAGFPAIVLLLFVLPFGLTLIGAVRTKRSSWTIAIAPILVAVLTLVTVATYAIFTAERPFD